MAKISTYSKVSSLNPNQKVIGTDENGQTKNIGIDLFLEQGYDTIELARLAAVEARNAANSANAATENVEEAIQNANNAKGWRALFRFEKDGEQRLVKKLIGYIDGTGIAPTDNIGEYVLETGYTTDKSLATNFKGTPFIYSDFTEQQLEDLKGPQGDSAYQVAVEHGFVGTEAEWLESLKLQYSDLTEAEILELQQPAIEAAQTANTAADNAKSATQNAISATNEANTATTNANNAANTANTSATNADTSAGLATTAANNANDAATAANTAAENADNSAQSANEATSSANNATTNANVATVSANTAADNANTATQNAITATNEANTATTNANNAATFANSQRGWTPIHTFEADGAQRQVKKLTDYIGGTGTKPTQNIGQYVIDGGYTADKSLATNFKGEQNDNLIAEYIHSGNLEVVVSSINYTTNTFTANNHGLINGDRVAFNITNDCNVLTQTPFSEMWTANSEGGGYFVANATQDTFQLTLSGRGVVMTLDNRVGNDFTKWKIERASPNSGIAFNNLNVKSLRCRILGGCHRTVRFFYVEPISYLLGYRKNVIGALVISDRGALYGSVEFDIDIVNSCDLINVNLKLMVLNNSSTHLDYIADNLIIKPNRTSPITTIPSITLSQIRPFNGTVIQILKK